MAAIAAGSWGTLVAYWREKTFQTLAIGVIGIVAFISVIEGLVALIGAQSDVGQIIGLLNPYRSIVPVLNPFSAAAGRIAAGAVPAMIVLTLVINAVTLWRLRYWNPPRHVHAVAKAIERETAIERMRQQEPRSVGHADSVA